MSRIKECKNNIEILSLTVKISNEIERQLHALFEYIRNDIKNKFTKLEITKHRTQNIQSFFILLENVT